MKTKYNLRAICAQLIEDVLEKGSSLSSALPHYQNKVNEKDRALLQELAFGIMRTLPLLEWYLKQLMSKELKGNQRILHYLLLVGLYQIAFTRIPPHAAVAESVNAAFILKKPQLKGLINGVLRNFQRQYPQLEQQAVNKECYLLHPQWLVQCVQKQYPCQWQTILDNNNQRPPMWLRVNTQKTTTEEYFQLLSTQGIEATLAEEVASAIRVNKPIDVNQLPHFDEGWITVQDLSAQRCALYLEPENGEQILDLCAAPGGKTTHILELAPQSELMAVDIDENRLKRVEENLTRLGLHANVKQGDGTTPEKWAEGKIFDRILLDAPCSATGVIRRHPDIKWLRRDSDIADLAQLQAVILDSIWPYLKKGGTLIYATCSIMPEENTAQIQAFLARTPDAQHISITASKESLGRQMLPSQEGGDGFYYAKLVKNG